MNINWKHVSVEKPVYTQLCGHVNYYVQANVSRLDWQD